MFTQTEASRLETGVDKFSEKQGGDKFKGKRPLDLEELARTIPGGEKRPENGDQGLLLHILSYIEFLQRKIQDAQSRLISPATPQESFLPLWPPAPDSNVTPGDSKAQGPVRKPKKKSRPREPSGAALKSRRCLSLHGNTEQNQTSPEKLAAQKERVSAVSAGPEEESLQVKQEERLRQKLVPYLSPSSSDDGDAGPWLLSLSLSPCCSQSSVLPYSSPDASTSAAHLGLSPSLLSSPTDHIMQGNSSQVLFEEVQLGSYSSPDLQGTFSSSAFTLDHSYQSQNESRTVSSAGRSSIQTPSKLIVNSKAKHPLARPRSYPGDSDKAGPLRKVCAGKGSKRGSHSFSRLQLLRKKCVNGFIMFCRVNRRPYLSAHPGTASTAATKELAELWRVMSAQERRPYCVKALQFSLLHGRLVKERTARLSHEDLTPPKPLSILMAEKAAPFTSP
ncbi:meiosis initiator protein [Discoglossus pictus]